MMMTFDGRAGLLVTALSSLTYFQNIVFGIISPTLFNQLSTFKVTSRANIEGLQSYNLKQLAVARLPTSTLVF